MNLSGPNIKILRSPCTESLQKKKGPMRWAVIEYPRRGVKDTATIYGQEIDYVIQNRQHYAGVVLKVYSPGGRVTTYGYLYGQTKRLRTAGLEVVGLVDEVAASGGYMMLLPANKILAGEFALIGSVGVVATVLNFYEILSRNGVLAREYTAGEFKRTVSNFNEVTPELEEEFKTQLEEIAVQFRDVVQEHRPSVSRELLNGKVWSGRAALERGLIDGLANSNQYLMELNATSELVYVVAPEKGGIENKNPHFLVFLLRFLD
jgi:serine protease SohB